MATFSDDIFFATIGELNGKLKARAFSATELTRAFCDRLEKLGPRYNALALSLRDTALRKARDVDDEIKRERFRGPLQGVPFGVKDLLSVSGRKTAWGAKPYANQIFDYDATVVRKLNGAGAILIGKLAMVELAGGGGYRYADASMNGPGLNPWDTTRWSGGSSSGSGVAVAAGLTTYAIASETWGSILTPSAYCGVTGLRPTYGLVSRHGAMALSWTMDKIGPMCRSAEDCGHVLHAISGGDSSDPASAGKRFYYTSKFVRKLSQLRVGFAPADIAQYADSEARSSFQTAVDAIRGLGVQMVEVELPEMPYSAVAGTIIAAEGSTAFADLIESGKVDQLADKKQIAGLRAGLEITAKDYLRAMRVRSVVRSELRKLFSKMDVLVSPSVFGVATKLTERLDLPEAPTPPGKPRGLRHLGAAGNLAGLPALSLPCGFAGGMPVALQLVGRPWTENTLLAIGVEFQRLTDWHRRRPPL